MYTHGSNIKIFIMSWSYLVECGSLEINDIKGGTNYGFNFLYSWRDRCYWLYTKGSRNIIKRKQFIGK